MDNRREIGKWKKKCITIKNKTLGLVAIEYILHNSIIKIESGIQRNTYWPQSMIAYTPWLWFLLILEVDMDGEEFFFLSLSVLCSHLNSKAEERMDKIWTCSLVKECTPPFEVEVSIYIQGMMLTGHPRVINTPEELHRLCVDVLLSFFDIRTNIIYQLVHQIA